MTRRLFPVICSLFLTCLAGCGARTAEVSGKITLKGKEPNLKGLRISFMGQDGMPITTEVGLDGSYRAANVPVGDVKVAFVHLPPEEESRSTPDKPARDAMPGTEDDKMTPEKARAMQKQEEERRQARSRPAQPASGIPARLADPSTSGVTTAIEGGKNNAFNYDLPEK
jgi:hypothetical protein